MEPAHCNHSLDICIRMAYRCTSCLCPLPTFLRQYHYLGCFHEDGLADTFDGFGGGWGRAQILRIMKDSRVGTYALVGTSLTLWLKIQVFVLSFPMRL